MSSLISFGYSDSADFSFNASEIELVGGKAQLKNQVGNASFSEDFADDTDFTYDSDKTEFAGGLVRQKSQRPANATFGATFTVGETASWGDGILSGILVGGASVTGGKLVIAAANHLATYAAASNMNIQQVGTIRFKFTPGYTGAPSSTSFLFDSGGTASPYRNRIGIYHFTDGIIYISVKDNTGANIFSHGFGAWSPTSGTPYEIELDLDVTAGASRLFINGVQSGSTDTATGTRDLTGCTLFVIGNTTGGTAGAIGSYDDIILFSTAQHTTNYTPGFALPAADYVTTTVTLPEIEHTLPGDLFLVNSFATTEVNAPRYTIQIGQSGNYLYWDSAAWVTSDGSYAQATSASDFNTNCGALDVDGEQYGQFKIHFTDSNTLSSVANLEVNLSMNTGYLTTNPSITTNTSFFASELIDFVATQTEAGSDLVKHILIIGGTPKYWNGAAIVTSNGTYAQSNTVAEITTNILAFLSTRHEVSLKSFLHSDDGTTTPNIDTIEIEYTSALSAPSLPDLVQLEGFVYGHNGALDSEVIYIRPYNEGFQNPGIVHKYAWETLTTTNSDGWFSANIFKQPSQKYWELKIGTKRYRIELESGLVNNLSSIYYEVI